MSSESGFNLNAAGDGLGAAAEAAPATGAPESAPETSFFGSRQPSNADTVFNSVFGDNELRRIPVQVQTFVDDVVSLLKQPFPDIEHGVVTAVQNFIYFKRSRSYQGTTVPVVQMIEFADLRYGDERDIGYRAVDINNAVRWIGEKFPSSILLEPITLRTNSPADMLRSRQTAEHIRDCLYYKTEAASSLTAGVFTNKVLETRYDVAEAASYLQMVSPQSTLPRIDTAATFQTVVNNNGFNHNARAWSTSNFANGDNSRPITVFTIGGYAEIGNLVTRTENGSLVTKYEVFYHVTAAHSRYNTLGMLAMGLATFASHIINDWGWVAQFYNKRANGDLGNIVEDGDNRGHFFTTDSNDETMEFAQAKCWPPVIILDSEIGFNLFSSVGTLTSQDPNKVNAVNNYLYGFFDKKDGTGQRYTGGISRLAALTLEGAYGDQQGATLDTRHFDWFKLAGVDGINALRSEEGALMRTLENNDMWTLMRYRLMASRTPNVMPMVECRKFAIVPEWLDYVSSAMTRFGIQIRDTSRGSNFARNVGSVSSEYIRDRVGNPTSAFGGNSSFDNVDVFG